MKCVKCMIEDAKEREAEFVYHGFSVCQDHFKVWHGMILKERDSHKSGIVIPGGDHHE